jgi:hypothetical protein
MPCSLTTPFPPADEPIYLFLLCLYENGFLVLYNSYYNRILLIVAQESPTAKILPAYARPYLLLSRHRRNFSHCVPEK